MCFGIRNLWVPEGEKQEAKELYADRHGDTPPNFTHFHYQTSLVAQNTGSSI